MTRTATQSTFSSIGRDELRWLNLNESYAVRIQGRNWSQYADGEWHASKVMPPGPRPASRVPNYDPPAVEFPQHAVYSESAPPTARLATGGPEGVSRVEPRKGDYQSHHFVTRGPGEYQHYTKHSPAPGLSPKVRWAIGLYCVAMLAGLFLWMVSR